MRAYLEKIGRGLLPTSHNSGDVQATPSEEKDLVRRVRRLQLQARRYVGGGLAGRYRSNFRGRGMEYEETRAYEPGDEVRAIDWRTTARTGRPFVKTFREERDLTLNLLVDGSGSNAFGSRRRLKWDLVTELAALLAVAAVTSGDRVGLTLFTDHVERQLLPCKGMNHASRIIHELVAWSPGRSGTSIDAGLDQLNRSPTGGSVAFLISDFQDVGFQPLLRVASLKHDLIPVVIADEREVTLPVVGLLRVIDPESGQSRMIDTADRRQRGDYERWSAAAVESRRRLFRELRLDWIELTTDSDPAAALHRLFARREAR